MLSCRNECKNVNIGQHIKKIVDVTTHTLCLVDSYHMIAQANILSNNLHHEVRYCP